MENQFSLPLVQRKIPSRGTTRRPLMMQSMVSKEFKQEIIGEGSSIGTANTGNNNEELPGQQPFLINKDSGLMNDLSDVPNLDKHILPPPAKENVLLQFHNPDIGNISQIKESCKDTRVSQSSKDEDGNSRDYYGTKEERKENKVDRDYTRIPISTSDININDDMLSVEKLSLNNIYHPTIRISEYFVFLSVLNSNYDDLRMKGKPYLYPHSKIHNNEVVNMCNILMPKEGMTFINMDVVKQIFFWSFDNIKMVNDWESTIAEILCMFSDIKSDIEDTMYNIISTFIVARIYHRNNTQKPALFSTVKMIFAILINSKDDFMKIKVNKIFPRRVFDLFISVGMSSDMGRFINLYPCMTFDETTLMLPYEVTFSFVKNFITDVYCD